MASRPPSATILNPLELAPGKLDAIERQLDQLEA